MNTTLQVAIKSVYGMNKIYPVNTPAEMLARIAGSKTITLQTLKTAMEMGFTVAVVAYYARVLCATFRTNDPLCADPVAALQSYVNISA